MIQMMKRDFYASRWYILIIFLLIPLFYAINVQYQYIYGYAILFIIFVIFNADYKNKINRFLVSLPIEQRKLVTGRYAYSLFVLLLLLIFHYIVDAIVHAGLPSLDVEPLTGQTILFIIFSLTIGISLSLPVYYFFKSFIIAAFVNGLLLGFGLFHIQFSTIHMHSNLISSLFSIGFLYGSYRLSFWLFERKDL